MRSPSDSSSEDRSLPTRSLSERLTVQALRESFGLPLAAMRVSVETLCDRLAADTQEARVSRSLLSSLNHVADDLETIVEFLSTPSPRPLSCTVDEILRSTRARLGALGSQVEVARSCAPDTWFVDGPLLVRLLARLLRAALEESSDSVLLCVRERRGGLRFAIVHSPGGEISTPPRAMRRITQCLARKEARLLGAELEVQAGLGEQVVTLLALPLVTAKEGGIAA